MEITINISLRDADRAVLIASKLWHKINEDEKREYEHLIALFGTIVIQKLLNK